MALLRMRFTDDTAVGAARKSTEHTKKRGSDYPPRQNQERPHADQIDAN